VRAEVEAAERLGVSYKRFQGWEPTTVYAYDDAGRMVSSRPEVEWDDTERAWMLALATWRDDEVCPLCGWPKDVCRDPMSEWSLEATLPVRCHVLTKIKQAQAGRESGKFDDALLWGVRVKGASAGP
jgi:hypothetical protein